MKDEVQISLTLWELDKLMRNCAIPNAMTYMQHEAMGNLRPDEMEEGQRWRDLGNKLLDAEKNHDR